MPKCALPTMIRCKDNSRSAPERRIIVNHIEYFAEITIGSLDSRFVVVMAGTTVGVPGFVGVSVMKNGKGIMIALHPSCKVVDKIFARFVPVRTRWITIVYPPVYVPGAVEYVEFLLVPIERCRTSTIFDKFKNVIIFVPNNIFDDASRIAIICKPVVRYGFPDAHTDVIGKGLGRKKVRPGLCGAGAF